MLKKIELEQAVKEIGANRTKMQNQLLEFADTDLLFFFSDKPELLNIQKIKWQPILDWAEDIYGIKLKITQSLDVPDNSGWRNALLTEFNSISDKEFCCWYAAALNLRSVLLGLVMIKGIINSKKASELSGLEELWQNKQWGEDEQALSARQRKAEELSVIESFCNA